uniref:substrate-binding domain-containing protein n=1 Tax=Staphylococcus sp. GDB8P47P TaxID=2804448 RepID=UPI001954F2D3
TFFKIIYKTFFSISISRSVFEKAYNETIEYLKFHQKPEGIFAANDITALGVLEAVKAMKISVPHEIEIIGFDNIKMAS